MTISRFLSMLPECENIFLNIGAQEGIYEVFLAKHYRRCIAFEGGDTSYLERSLGANDIKNIEIIHGNPLCALPQQSSFASNSTFRESSEKIFLLRINLDDPLPMIKGVHELIQKDLPIILIQSNKTLKLSAVTESLMSFGYTAGQPFSLAPNSALCVRKELGELCSWPLR